MTDFIQICFKSVPFLNTWAHNDHVVVAISRIFVIYHLMDIAYIAGGVCGGAFGLAIAIPLIAMYRINREEARRHGTEGKTFMGAPIDSGIKNFFEGLIRRERG